MLTWKGVVTAILSALLFVSGDLALSGFRLLFQLQVYKQAPAAVIDASAANLTIKRVLIRA